MKKNKPWQTMWRVCATLFALLWMSQVLYAVDVSVTVDKPMKDGVVEISLGQSVQLTAHAPSDKIRWQSRKYGTQKYIAMKDDAGNYIVENPLVVTPVESTEYRIMYIDDTGSYFSEPPITIIVVAPRDLIISANKIDLSLGEDVTLTATTETDVLLGRVRWQKQVGNGSFEDMHTDTGAPVIGETVTDIPQAGGTCYRAIGLKASGEEVISEPVCVTSKYTCSTNSAYVIFTDDFGQLDSETARSSNQYVGKDYTYVSGCGWLKDEGTYAVMANARYGGCNVDGVTDGCGCTHASNDQMWFRDIYDHTQGGVDTDGKYGGMLLVNANKQLVYSRKVSLPCAKTNLIFSAWFATASKGATSSVSFFVKDRNGNEIKEATFPIEDIDFKDGWIKGETSFYTGDETEFTVEIHNYREGTDKGNDFLVDDISFSVCSPEISIIPSTTSENVQVNVEEGLVQGSCNDEFNLSIQTSMAEAVFTTPYYMWFAKGVDDSDFVHLPDFDGLTQIGGVITPYTQYHAVVTANIDEAQAYLQDKNAVRCIPIAMSNVVNVLCTPNLSVTASQQCNNVTLWAHKEDDPNNKVSFKWQISNDGVTWRNILRPANQDSIHYTLTEPSYFRITSAIVSSPATEQFQPKGLALVATPNRGVYDAEVTLTATPTNLDFTNGEHYDWYRINNNLWESIMFDDLSKNSQKINIQAFVDTIIVVADGCKAQTIVKQIEFNIEPIGVDCNDVYLQPIAQIGEDESIKFKWQRSADGTTWQDVAASDIREEDIEELQSKVTIITISENSVFRLAEIDDNGTETGTYSLVHPLPSDEGTEYYKFKKLELTATPTFGEDGTEVELKASQEGFEMGNGDFFNWYKFNEERQDWEQLEGIEPTRTHTIDSPIAQFKIEVEGCEAEVTVKELAFDIEPIDRECNDIILEPIATLGGEPIAFKWQRSADGVTWEDVDDSAIKTEPHDDLGQVVRIAISENSMFRLAEIDASGNETGIYSSIEQAILYEVKELTLTANPTTIKKDGSATLTLVAQNFDATTAAQWFVVKGDNDEEFTPSSSTEHIIASLSETTTYKVIWDMCDATATVNVIQPASVAVMERNCNVITMQATVDDTYGDFFWETSKDGIEWETLAGKENQTSINVTITETTYFRVNNALDMPSDASYANDVHSITLEVDKEEINRDEQVTLTATADFSSNFAIKWYQNGEEIDNTANPYSPTLQTDATFYVALEGCESESVSINVIQPASVEFVSRVCNEITLSATVEEGVSYKWQKSKDGNTWTEMSETGSPITVTITENTKFRVKTDDVKSEPTDIIELWGVTLSVDKNSVILGEEVNVTATSSSSEPIVWYENNQPLDFDGDVYTVKPYGPTSFQVTQGGCPSKTVTVTDVLWPTVFTPMLSDGFNDDFIQGMDPAVALKIYDRYGNLVIETTDGWDGKDSKGNYALPGVYYYVATLPSGEMTKGNVELLNEKK